MINAHYSSSTLPACVKTLFQTAAALFSCVQGMTCNTGQLPRGRWRATLSTGYCNEWNNKEKIFVIFAIYMYRMYLLLTRQRWLVFHSPFLICWKSPLCVLFVQDNTHVCMCLCVHILYQLHTNRNVHWGEVCVWNCALVSDCVSGK